MTISTFTGAAEEVAAITAIYRHWVENGIASFELEAPDEAEMAQRLKALQAKDYPILIARKDHAIIGYSYASAYRPRPAYGATVEDTVYVAAGHHGEGHGKRLLEHLIEGWAEIMGRLTCAGKNLASVRLAASGGTFLSVVVFPV